LEAKVAMDIAQVDKTEEFACGSRTNQTEEIPVLIDLNDVPFKLKEGHLARMIALKKTGDTFSTLLYHKTYVIFYFSVNHCFLT
jgi:hypothetical protein